MCDGCECVARLKEEGINFDTIIWIAVCPARSRATLPVLFTSYPRTHSLAEVKLQCGILGILADISREENGFISAGVPSFLSC